MQPCGEFAHGLTMGRESHLDGRRLGGEQADQQRNGAAVFHTLPHLDRIHRRSAEHRQRLRLQVRVALASKRWRTQWWVGGVGDCARSHSVNSVVDGWVGPCDCAHRLEDAHDPLDGAAGLERAGVGRVLQAGLVQS